MSARRSAAGVIGVLAVFAAAALLGSCAAVQKGADALAAQGKISEKDRAAIVQTSQALRSTFSDITDEEEYYIGRSVSALLLAQYKTFEAPALRAESGTSTTLACGSGALESPDITPESTPALALTVICRVPESTPVRSKGRPITSAAPRRMDLMYRPVRGLALSMYGPGSRPVIVNVPCGLGGGPAVWPRVSTGRTGVKPRYSRSASARPPPSMVRLTGRSN